MKIVFRTYDSSYYDMVCYFLINLSKDNRTHINWNWARWEWMVFHPEFQNNLADRIGLWFSSTSNELVGMTTFDHYFGEAFYAVKKGYEELEKEILGYALNNFSNETGLGIAVNDYDSHTIDFLVSNGFVMNDNAENILESNLESNSFDYSLPKGIRTKSLNTKTDLYKHQKVLWEGFENDGDLPDDEKTINEQKRMLSAPHLNSYIHIVAEKEDGEYVAYCGCWFNSNTDYAYVEPVCTIPGYRKKGIGQAVLLEALKRCYTLGAKKAYVIADQSFYKSLGFVDHSHFHFYWHY
ncbi:Acetyltransferase (GNAT) domain-containing protein [Gracilibacillus orientalis]|uniref:Acetyltransferase (GNAT) domain-containing protein n=1 Tax=Gracilibacillus orientalis TaxID=334253 RepID=A0A1I4H968_9BACI|nr:GNAT family N-acetyltransferase [Gracilibacillus orientalis]SFL38203.1 Acetyltransferase (GNAT) domain-containing protein [Gracilibacillus orientalis]